MVNHYWQPYNLLCWYKLLATFGAPVESISHPQQAFSAACQILALVERMNKEGNLPQVRLGIGMHSGEVITGG